jgi:CW-type Zinc Finger
VIIDQHFNPTIALQAISRVYRYGQTKPVFCYTLLTQGTTEEKVFGRCVNKASVALRVIDNKTIERLFTDAELQELTNNFLWVQCNVCDKWRILLGKVPDEDLPDHWECSMNSTDKVNNNCKASEKSQAWYEKHGSSAEVLPASPAKSVQRSVAEEKVGKQDGSEDVILRHLLSITEVGKEKTLVSEHRFHDAIMETTTTSETLEQARLGLIDSKQLAGDVGCPVATSPKPSLLEHAMKSTESGDKKKLGSVEEDAMVATLSRCKGATKSPLRTATAPSNLTSPSRSQSEPIVPVKPCAADKRSEPQPNGAGTPNSPKVSRDNAPSERVPLTPPKPNRQIKSEPSQPSSRSKKPGDTATVRGASSADPISCFDSDEDEPTVL